MSKMIMPMLTALLCGCAIEDAESVDSDLTDEETGIVKQELGEPGCGTIPSTLLTGDHGIIHSVFSTSGTNPENSPNWLYNVSPECPLQFVTEYTNLPSADINWQLRAAASIYDGNNFVSEQSFFWSIDNEADCERTRIYYGVYVWNTNTTNPSNTYTVHVRGNWLNGACRNSVISGSLPVQVDTGKYKIRIAGRVEFCRSSDCANWGALQTNLRVQTHLERVHTIQ